ncbi:hypothetical protein FPSE_01766 [Fusarium pseudograminearum CS3096]|uniref:Uncharacterized protein n=1 Tax=Fusarium pseudograminearum (strain CS3096) TaxID=1028729 RepID=K3VSN1_FUSPC|nr:hypothetical protein FPSE_01766 [Fusarium pseudograminearum CS3096]EKJ78304.1 hypothetical protein FPSE_01766 [Fusarium pseudograminearum CS3096]
MADYLFMVGSQGARILPSQRQNKNAVQTRTRISLGS